MLWIPGPTEVRPEILAECARPAIGHRSPAMGELIERLDPHLALAFGLLPDSDALPAVHSSSASGLMEASLRGVGSRVLCIVNGAFSQRYRIMAELLGKQVETLEVTWGAGVDPLELKGVLKAKGPFDALTFVSNETSTGVRTPIDSVSDCLRDFPETLLLVYLVSLIAGAPVEFDANRIDFGFAGIQKALACPPGLAVFCASQRYMEVAREQSLRGWSLDPVRLAEGHRDRKTPATPSTSLYYALAKQLEDISAGVSLPPSERHKRGAAAWQARFAKHIRMQALCRDWARGQGLELLPSEHFASPTVSCIRAGSIDVAKFCAGLATRGFEISNGYGQLKGKTFRIGHMGDHTEAGLGELLCAADEVIRSLA